jgi:diguanylate cyclase (GGDEF)-like protein
VVTISIGVGTLTPHCETYADLFSHADRALYEAKRAGRNGFAVGA